MDELGRVRTAKGLLLVLLLVTDIPSRGSHVWFVGARRDLVEQALGRPLVDDGTYLEGCMSRKKQIVQPLELVFTKDRERGRASAPRPGTAE